MKRYIVAAAVGILLAHHIVCTLLYNSPLNPLNNSYQQYVAGYMDPLFTQKWMLFAPEPATNDLKLWYRLRQHGCWTTWYDPLEPVLKKHQKRRFTYNAKLLYVYGNIPRDLGAKNEELSIQFSCAHNNDSCVNAKNKRLVDSDEFQLARKFVIKDALKSFRGIAIDSLQIMIIQLYPKQFSERLSNKPFGYANATEFTPVAFNE
jgi:hypothetical protein